MNRLVSCKVCKKNVATSARTCPHCGVRNPGVSTAQGFLAALVLVVVIAAIVAYCSRENLPVVANGTAHSYQIVMDENLDNGLRTRHRWFINSDAISFEDRAATVIRAAADLRYKYWKDESFIVLRNGKGDPLAMADYIPDSHNQWDVQSSTDDSLYLLKKVEIK